LRHDVNVDAESKRKITMKTLIFVAAMSVLSATEAFAQVDFSLGAPGVPPVTYTDGSGVALSGQDQPAPQQVRQHRYRMTTQRVGGYTKIANGRRRTMRASTAESASWAHDGHYPIVHVNR
jgi:hypothetical protein